MKLGPLPPSVPLVQRIKLVNSGHQPLNPMRCAASLPRQSFPETVCQLPKLEILFASSVGVYAFLSPFLAVDRVCTEQFLCVHALLSPGCHNSENCLEMGCAKHRSAITATQE